LSDEPDASGCTMTGIDYRRTDQQTRESVWTEIALWLHRRSGRRRAVGRRP
jgi:hypothetical protein